MNRTERLTAVLDMLAAAGQVEVQDVVDRIGASPATVRRDLDALAQQQLLTRTRGGAIAHSVAYDLPIRYKNLQHADQKAAIAREAAALVPRGAVIGVSGGTTTTAIVDALMARADIMEPAGHPGLTVVTNAINIAMRLAMRHQIKTVLTGGVVQPQSYEVVGPFTEEVLRATTLDIAFIGVNGMEATLGPTTFDEREAAVSRLMAQRATRVVVVADSSKLGKRTFASVGPERLAHTVITDAAAPPEQVELLRESGYEVVVAAL